MPPTPQKTYTFKYMALTIFISLCKYQIKKKQNAKKRGWKYQNVHSDVDVDDDDDGNPIKMNVNREKKTQK